MNKLDLLFVVDNSKGMERAQQGLADALPTFLDALANGHRIGEEDTRFPGATDMHVGVVSTDMGVLGAQHIEGCSPDGGDDGRLQHKAMGEECEQAYPPYLNYSAESATADIENLSKDLACIAPVGTNGCEYVQPLEAAFKALTPSVTEFNDQTIELTFPATTADGVHGRGDQIGGARGFLRDDAVLGIIVMTDDDDTSMRESDAFRSAAELPRDSVLRAQDPKLRAYSNPESLYPVDRYVNGYQFWHIAHRERVVFGAIAGVPADLVDAQAVPDYHDIKALGEYYEAVLGDERMTQRVDESTHPGSGQGALMPSCMHSGRDGTASQPASPPRRLVELARDFGPSGVIQSICQDDMTQALAPIVDRVASQLGSACLETPLQRRPDGSVACDVIWELDNKDYLDPALPPYECADREFLKPATKRRHDRDGNNCNVRQLVAADADHLPSGEGFYYDDFTPSPENNCREGRGTRIRFTPGVVPDGVMRVVLDCSPEALGK